MSFFYQILILPCQEYFLWNAHKHVKFVSLPFFSYKPYFQRVTSIIKIAFINANPVQSVLLKGMPFYNDRMT